MILKVKQWCEGIIVAIIISIIIEMILPEGKNKKYVKVIIGVYIMFVVLNPILEIINYDIKFDDFFDFEGVVQTSTTTDVNENMKDVYVIGIQELIKSDIEEMGYSISDVTVYVDNDYENIEKIELKGIKLKDNICIDDIEPVVIGKQTPKSNFKYTDIIEYLQINYSVSEEKIIFK